MIIGTAGHVDHGKTALVRALTGVETDRLAEERRRGITLELGFAHLALPDGTLAGVVDVPGHERFVKAMAAGAGGVDLALLVVASDEGVMPQTREHLDICRLLGVRKGVIALTKSDLLGGLGEEWRALVEADVRELVEGTFLEDAERIACSARTGEGLDALREALGRAAAESDRRPREGPAFLPVDRAFSIKGFGTVVTGTLLSGQLRPEMQVSLLPGSPGPFRVRGLEVHGKSVPLAEAGTRTAVNVVGVEAKTISRGCVLCEHEVLPETAMLDVELTLLPAAKSPLARRSKLLLHLGTTSVEATVALLDLPELSPGETALAQLRLGAPVLALPEQRFILRGSRPLEGRGATVAGGRVLHLTPPRRKKGAAQVLRPLLEATPDSRLEWLLRQSGAAGLTLRDLHARGNLPLPLVRKQMEVLASKRRALLVDKEQRRYLSPEVLEGLCRRALARLSAFHEAEPMKEGLSREALRQGLSGALDPKLFARLLSTLVERNEVELSEEWVRLPGRGRTLTVSEEAVRQRLLEELAQSELSPPKVDVLAGKLGLSQAALIELLKVAMAEGAVVKVTEALYFDRLAVDALEARLMEALERDGELSTQSFKALVGGSRKFVIPLSEYFDRRKVTLRVGDKRVRRRG